MYAALPLPWTDRNVVFDRQPKTNEGRNLNKYIHIF